MAKAQRGPGRQSRVDSEAASGASAAFASLPEGSTQKILYTDLTPHPDNREICGELPARKKESLKADILLAGIREQLHVWWHEGRWIIVSGNERHELVSQRMTDAERRSANGGEGLEYLPCVVKRFSSPAAARVHLEAANKDRKVIKDRPATERLQLYMPMAEYPILYASLVGNFAEDTRITEVNLPGGKITQLEKPLSGVGIQSEKRRLVTHAAEITGWSEGTVRKVLSKIAAAAKPKKKASPKKKQPPAVLKKLDLAEIKFAIDHFIGKRKAKGLQQLRDYLDTKAE